MNGLQLVSGRWMGRGGGGVLLPDNPDSGHCNSFKMQVCN